MVIGDRVLITHGAWNGILGVVVHVPPIPFFGGNVVGVRLDLGSESTLVVMISDLRALTAHERAAEVAGADR